MELWAELFSDWVGILSFGVIAFVIVIAVFFIKFFLGHIDDPSQE
jgi:hypothetical protein